MKYAKLKHYAFSKAEESKGAEILLLILDIGMDDNTPKSDRFEINVLDVKGVGFLKDKYLGKVNYLHLNHTLLIESFNEEKIIGEIKSDISKVKGESWEEIAQKLSVFLSYEFAPGQYEWSNCW